MDTATDPIDADELCRKMSQSIDAGRPGSAQALLAAAQALKGPTPAIALLQARLALAQGEVHRAVEALDMAIIVHPDHHGLRKQRADLRYSLGDWQGAAQDAAEAVTLAPADAEAKVLLGGALLALGQTSQGIACLDEALAATPASVTCREMLARAWEDRGQADTALRVLTDGLAAKSANARLYAAVIRRLIERRDLAQALHLAEQARARGRADAGVLVAEAQALETLGRRREAAIAYQDALKMEPENADVRHRVMAHGLLPTTDRASPDYLKAAFDRQAEQHEAASETHAHAVAPVMRSVIGQHPAIVLGRPVGPVLDLGCGAGSLATALRGLPVGPITGIDLSPAMLRRAAAAGRYAALREADILQDLAEHDGQWPLIVAADVARCFGALQNLLVSVRRHLLPDGWLVFSVEALLPDHYGFMSGNGDWALRPHGRYAHALDHVYDCIAEADMRLLRKDTCAVSRENGEDVPGWVLTATPVRR